MRKQIACILLLLFIYVIFAGCAKQDYIIDTQEKADITLIDEAFSCSAEECIDILNEDLAGTDLTQIPNHCAKEAVNANIDHDNEQKEYEYIIYRYNISESLELDLYSQDATDSSDSKISALKIVCKSSAETANEEKAKADMYFKAICDNVCPAFDVNKFLEDAKPDNSTQAGNITFYTRLFNANDEESAQHKERIYCVSVMPDNDIL